MPTVWSCMASHVSLLAREPGPSAVAVPGCAIAAGGTLSWCILYAKGLLKDLMQAVETVVRRRVSQRARESLSLEPWDSGPATQSPLDSILQESRAQLKVAALHL